MSQNDGKRKARAVQNKEYNDKEDAGLARNGRKRLINGKVYTVSNNKSDQMNADKS